MISPGLIESFRNGRHGLNAKMESRFVFEKVALDEQILSGKNAKLAKMENGLHGQLVKL